MDDSHLQTSDLIDRATGMWPGPEPLLHTFLTVCIAEQEVTARNGHSYVPLSTPGAREVARQVWNVSTSNGSEVTVSAPWMTSAELFIATSALRSFARPEAIGRWHREGRQDRANEMKDEVRAAMSYLGRRIVLVSPNCRTPEPVVPAVMTEAFFEALSDHICSKCRGHLKATPWSEYLTTGEAERSVAGPSTQ